MAQHTLHLLLYCYSLLRYSPVHSVLPGHARCAPVGGAQNKHQPCRTSTNKPYITSFFRAGRQHQNGDRSSRACKHHRDAQGYYWIMEQPFRRRGRHFGRTTEATDPDYLRCNGKRQHSRRHMRHILVLHDETELQTRSGVDVDFGRLLQKLMVSDLRLSEPCAKPSHQRRTFLPGERVHAANGTPGMRYV